MAQRITNQLVEFFDAPILEPKKIEAYNANIQGDVSYKQITPRDAGPWGESYTRVATFEINDLTCAWDLFDSTVKGQIILANTDSVAKIDGDADSFFSRWRLLSSNNIVLETLDVANVAIQAQKIISMGSGVVHQKWESLGADFDLAESAKTSLGSTTAVDFELDIPLSFAKYSKILHCPILKGCKLELTTELNANMFSTCSAGVQPKIQNLRLNAKMIQMTPDYIEDLYALASKGGLKYQNEGLLVEDQDWSQKNGTYTIEYPAGSVNMALQRFYNSSDYNAVGNLKYICKSQYLTGFNSAQVIHGTNPLPATPIDNAITASTMLKKAYAMNQSSEAQSLITPTSYVAGDANSTFSATPQFYLGYDFTSSGINTGLDCSNTRLTFKTGGSAGIAGLRSQIFLWYSQIIEVRPHGDIRVYSVME